MKRFVHKLKQSLRAAARFAAGYSWDSLALAGVALVAVGLWWIYAPAALLAVGALLVFLGLWGAAILARERARRRPRDDG
jgi:hypothetical protein